MNAIGTMVYDGRLFWVATPYSAMRPKGDRIEVLNWANGEVVYKCQTAPPKMVKAVRSVMRGIA